MRINKSSKLRKVLSMLLIIIAVVSCLIIPAEASTLPFTDVSITSWYYEPVVFVYYAGLMGGTSNTLFSPNANMRRGDLARKLAADGKKFPKIYMSCGEKDFLYDANVNFRDELKTLGADVTWTQNPSYGHEWRFWNEQVEAFLDWLPRTDYYGLQGKRSI